MKGRGLTRRALWPTPLALAGLGCQSERPSPPSGKSVVTVLSAPSYDRDLVETILQGARLCGLDVNGKSVLLKPNLVEFDSVTCINTSPAVVAAAFEAFERLGAAEIRIGEGPGHRRDTLGLAEEAGYFKVIRNFEDRFVDLNRDDVNKTTGFLDEGRMYFARTVMAADLIVTMPKMKTHHWAGVTLAMKNLFGLVPGSVYGWPKNPLHYAGIDTSIVELNRKFRKTFAIVDGIVGMEGNGPIQGSPKAAGVLVMGSDVVAVDATCCRVMSIDPEKVPYLHQAVGIGNLDVHSIEQRGEAPERMRQRFRLLPQFEGLRLG
jgi:uncharacterized protein (DUF362 family)